VTVKRKLTEQTTIYGKPVGVETIWCNTKVLTRPVGRADLKLVEYTAEHRTPDPVWQQFAADVQDGRYRDAHIYTCVVESEDPGGPDSLFRLAVTYVDLEGDPVADLIYLDVSA
jgi:hypothetical protein